MERIMHGPARMQSVFLLTLAVTLVACGGTGGGSGFVDPEADLPYYERVGVIPFESLGGDRAAGLQVTSVFFTELLKRDFAQVAEPGQFTAAMVRARGNKPAGTPWSTEELARLMEEANVQGVFMGTVRNYEMVRSGRSAYPMISMEVRLVDTATGRMVWSASETKKEGAGIPGFNWGKARTLPDLATKMSRRLLESLP
jgi:hypothetical protein